MPIAFHDRKGRLHISDKCKILPELDPDCDPKDATRLDCGSTTWRRRRFFDLDNAILDRLSNEHISVRSGNDL